MGFSVHLSYLQAALRALHLSLEIVVVFHDVVSYLLAFAPLGNSPNCFCALNPEPLTQDWEGLTGLVNYKYCLLKVNGSMCKRV